MRNVENFVSTNLLKVGFLILVVGIVLVFIAPYVLTQLSIGYDLSDKGQIGDAIAGTTAPIVGLIGSVLIFLSLYAQIEANRLVLNEFIEERRRYEAAAVGRERDRSLQQGRDLFLSLLELIRNQDQDLLNLRIINDSLNEGKRGAEAAHAIFRQVYSGESSSFFPLIQAIVVNLDNAGKLADEADLELDQKLILSGLILGVATKLMVILQVLPNVSSSPLSNFEKLVREVMVRATNLGDQAR